METPEMAKAAEEQAHTALNVQTNPRLCFFHHNPCKTISTATEGRSTVMGNLCRMISGIEIPCAWEHLRVV